MLFPELQRDRAIERDFIARGGWPQAELPAVDSSAHGELIEDIYAQSSMVQSATAASLPLFSIRCGNPMMRHDSAARRCEARPSTWRSSWQIVHPLRAFVTAPHAAQVPRIAGKLGADEELHRVSAS